MRTSLIVASLLLTAGFGLLGIQPAAAANCGTDPIQHCELNTKYGDVDCDLRLDDDCYVLVEYDGRQQYCRVNYPDPSGSVACGGDYFILWVGTIG